MSTWPRVQRRVRTPHLEPGLPSSENVLFYSLWWQKKCIPGTQDGNGFSHWVEPKDPDIPTWCQWVSHHHHPFLPSWNSSSVSDEPLTSHYAPMFSCVHIGFCYYTVNCLRARIMSEGTFDPQQQTQILAQKRSSNNICWKKQVFTYLL